jgi:chromosome segregation ATPase
MRLVPATALGILLLCPMSFGQTEPPNSRALQSILEEVQKLRQDLRMTAATVQRAQLLLYRMRLQLDAVSRATERLEQARNELNQFKFQRNQSNEQLKYMQDRLDRTQDSASRTQLEEAISRTKQWLEQSSAGEPEAQVKEVECANQLRLEQEKLEDLQRQLDQLDRRLEVAAVQPGPTR